MAGYQAKLLPATFFAGKRLEPLSFALVIELLFLPKRHYCASKLLFSALTDSVGRRAASACDWSRVDVSDSF